MRHAHLLAGLCAALITIAQPALADHQRPSVRLEITGLKVFGSAVGGVTYVAGGRHYWVPDGYREHRYCDDRRHDPRRHVHFYYERNPADYGHRWDDEDSDEDSDSDRKKHRRRHHHHHRGHPDRGVSETIIITVPVY